jgi:hypothetical protein
MNPTYVAQNFSKVSGMLREKNIMNPHFSSIVCSLVRKINSVPMHITGYRKKFITKGDIPCSVVA